MTVFEKIKGLLDEREFVYEVIEHGPVHTSADAAKIRDTDVSNGAKALVMFADKTPLLFVVPGDKKADFKKIKRVLDVKDLRMATPGEVLELTTLKVGSIPPIGKAINLKSYFDTSFEEKDEVAFNAGSLTTSIIMKSKDLISVEEPRLVEIV